MPLQSTESELEVRHVVTIILQRNWQHYAWKMYKLTSSTVSQKHQPQRRNIKLRHITISNLENARRCKIRKKPDNLQVQEMPGHHRPRGFFMSDTINFGQFFHTTSNVVSAQKYMWYKWQHNVILIILKWHWWQNTIFFHTFCLGRNELIMSVLKRLWPYNTAGYLAFKRVLYTTKKHMIPKDYFLHTLLL